MTKDKRKSTTCSGEGIPGIPERDTTQVRCGERQTHEVNTGEENTSLPYQFVSSRVFKLARVTQAPREFKIKPQHEGSVRAEGFMLPRRPDV